MKAHCSTFFLGVLLVCFLIFPMSAAAIPALGVGPGEPGSPGTYLGPYPSGEDLYQLVFANSFVGGGGGFLIDSDGGEITIWYGADNGRVNLDMPVYLATDSANWNNTWTFTPDGGTALDFVSNPALSVATYKPPIHAVNLGSINNPEGGGDWYDLDVGEFGAGKNMSFYAMTGILNAPEIEPGEWVYAATLTLNPGEVDQFSPPTTAATTPIPGTALLFGAGLAGLLGFRRRFKK